MSAIPAAARGCFVTDIDNDDGSEGAFPLGHKESDPTPIAGRVIKQTRIEERERIAELEKKNSELESLFDRQFKRSTEANKLWQQAHNSEASPDLGELLEWLVENLKKRH
tara:strand:+ start:2639 stop:2968 length:330 start_codon:yes stop_codon:yes gene_type:complete